MTSQQNLSPRLVALIFLFFSVSCGGSTAVTPTPRPRPPQKQLALMRYSIQVGAFANLDNAVRLTDALKRRGLDAYYFLSTTGLYKVRFGDLASEKKARRKAKSLEAAGVIENYYIVSPNDYAVVRKRTYGKKYLRDEIVQTAKNYIGLPYRWGGSSPDRGFDCSGLTMTVYRLNGLNLPRSSRQQYRTGTPIDRRQLQRGDLVFFATSGRGRVSHVGIYAGRGNFIHSPGSGKTIRTESLSNRYFRAHYMGARTYLR